MKLLPAISPPLMATARALHEVEREVRRSFDLNWLPWGEFIDGFSPRIRRELRDENARNAAWRGGRIGRVRWK